MQVTASTAAPGDSGADTIAVGVFDGERVDQPELQALLDSGEAKTKAGSLGLTHVDGRRHLLAGLGKREDFQAEGARVAAAIVAKRALELGARSLCWAAPASFDERDIGALVEGTILANYRFDRYKTAQDEPRPSLAELTICANGEWRETVARAAAIAEAVNSARVLQETPANDMTPTDLADRARAIAIDHPNVTLRIEGRKEIVAREMGAFAAVAQGSTQEPALITMHYKGPKAAGPVLGFVGKAVTFDTGGISIKPSAAMEEMKFDMSGGAVVLEAVAAIARLALPVEIVAVVGATENMPSGSAVKPGDVVRTLKGITVEVNNTDCEGRLVLADCIAHAVSEGAERLVDLATLTGAALQALGHTHAALIGNDDRWAAEVSAAATTTGEIVWRLPLHAEYHKLVEGTYADLNNAPERNMAGAILGAEFLAPFAGDVPWVHLDIAGTAWELGRAYAAQGGSGWGVRLLVELASAQR